MASTQPTWRLQGSTRKVIACHVQPTHARVHAVTIVFGSDTCLDETYPDRTSAMARALQVRDRLLEDGAWALVTDDAPLRRRRGRVTSAPTDTALEGP